MCQMNDLIISIAKERMLPLAMDLIDYPNEHTETQLYRMVVYLTRSILDAYILVSNWSACDAPKDTFAPYTEETCLSLAFKSVFPPHWIAIAETSPHFHLNVHKIIRRYDLQLSDESVARIHQVVEFFAYELIESAFLHANLIRMHAFLPEHLHLALQHDSILRQVLLSQNIHLVRHLQLNASMISVSHLSISNRGLRILRAYIEELVRAILDGRVSEHALTLDDLNRFFEQTA